MQKSFRDQLEDAAKILFTKQPIKEIIPQKQCLPFPAVQGLQEMINPVEVTRKHWAGYCCQFSADWYEMRNNGFTPLDDYGFEFKKVEGIWVFDFHLLTVNKVMYAILKYICDDKIDYTSIITACKVYTYLDLYLLDFSAFDVVKNRGRIVLDALEAFRCQRNIFDVDAYQAVTSTLKLFVYLEDEDWLIHSTPRLYKSRWYFPLIPSKLYENPKFVIRDWSFL